MVATYFRHGRGHSINALNAHDQGRFPATHAARILGISAKLLREVAEPSEWHHVGKYATRCDYYDTAEQPSDVCRAILDRKLKPEARATWQRLLDEATEREATEAREIGEFHIRWARDRHGYAAVDGEDAGDFLSAHDDCDRVAASAAERRETARRAICWLGDERCFLGQEVQMGVRMIGEDLGGRGA